MLIFHLAVLLISLGLLFWSANEMLTATIGLSSHYKISPLITGIVLVGLATSSPEIAVSALAAWGGQPEIAIGNAFGSNITNLLLVFGCTAIIAVIHTTRKIITFLFPLVLAATVLPGVLMLDLDLSRIDGVVLVVVLFVLLYWMIKRLGDSVEVPETETNTKQDTNMLFIWFAISITLLLISSEIAVNSAVKIAELLNISKLIIGLTVIALGTSLPEIATSIIGTYRKRHSIVVGNILGSNIFNSLAVLGTAALITPSQIPMQALTRDFAVMIVATLLVWGLFARQQCLGRNSGILIVLIFISYMSYLLIK